MTHVDTLARLLAPAGGGIHLVSTGLAEARELQRRLYRANSDAEIDGRWREALARVGDAAVVVLGVPSDVGAGFRRGANLGPAAIRTTTLDDPDHPVHDGRVVDAGDVRVVPHLLSDEMVDESQLRRCRLALYGDEHCSLPVSPLDICRRALDELRAINPRIVPIVLGGDHSVGWPAFASAHAHAHARGTKIGLLHFDAHTDLLESRLGVTYCFATWAYHANELLGRDGRLVQVGIRASARVRDYWESSLGVRQYWPEELAEKSTVVVVDEISRRFDERAVGALYVSNDIDGTDAAYASATGTPEPGGLHPDFVSELTARLLERYPLAGADLVEVAPVLAGPEGEPERTLVTASRYFADLVRAPLSS